MSTELTLEELAKLSKMSIRTLRYYIQDAVRLPASHVKDLSGDPGDDSGPHMKSTASRSFFLSPSTSVSTACLVCSTATSASD